MKNIEESISYSEYISEKIDPKISYSDYLYGSSNNISKIKNVLNSIKNLK